MYVCPPWYLCGTFCVTNICINRWTKQISGVWLKVKVHSKTGHEVSEGKQKCSSTLSLTTELDEGRWLTPLPYRFTPGKETRYHLNMRLGGPQGRYGRVRKISTSAGIDSRTVRPVASRYIDCAIAALWRMGVILKCWDNCWQKKRTLCCRGGLRISLEFLKHAQGNRQIFFDVAVRVIYNGFYLMRHRKREGKFSCWS